MIISLEGIDLPKESCTYVYTLYEKETMYDLKKVKIISLEKKRNWTKIKLKEKDEDAVIIYLRENSKENLTKLFDTIFSKTKVEKPLNLNCEKGMSKFELFKCWGFPSSIRKDAENETYNYSVEFVGIIDGFAIATIKIKDDKIISISGSL